MRSVTPDPTPTRRPWLLGAIAAAAVVVSIAPDLRPGIDNWDTLVKTEVAWNILHGRGPILTRAPAPLYVIPGSDGRSYAPYPLFTYVLQLPSALSALWTGAPYEGLAPLILLAVTGWVLAVAGLRLGASRNAAIAGALLTCLGTALRPMVGVGHDNGVEALALAVLLWASTFEDRPAAFAWAGLATGLALSTRLGAVPLLAGGAALVLAQRPRTWRAVATRGLAFAAGCAPCVAIILAFNQYRFGSPFEFPLISGEITTFVPWLSRAHLDGVLGLAVSPGKGLLWYSPTLIPALLLAAPLARRFPAPMAALGAYLGIALLFYGRLTFWHGDWGWGPRYVSPICVATAPLVWWAWERLSPSRPRGLAIAVGAGALVIALQAVPNLSSPNALYLNELGRRAVVEGTPAPRLVMPLLENGDYFYFRLDTSPIVVLARVYARSLWGVGAGSLLGERVRSGLLWALLGPAILVALLAAPSRRWRAGEPRIVAPPSPT